MSVIAERWAWRKRKMNPSAKYLLLCLARRHEARNNVCTPSMKDLAADSCMGLTSIRRNLDALEEKGIIEIGRKKGFGQRCFYTFINFDLTSKNGEGKAKAKPTDLGEKQESMFDTLWEIYPRKVNKKEGKRAFCRLIPEDGLYKNMYENIVARVQGEWSDQKNKKYIPHFSSYVSKELWLDEVEAPEADPYGGDNEYKKGL